MNRQRSIRVLTMLAIATLGASGCSSSSGEDAGDSAMTSAASSDSSDSLDESADTNRGDETQDDSAGAEASASSSTRDADTSDDGGEDTGAPGLGVTGDLQLESGSFVDLVGGAVFTHTGENSETYILLASWPMTCAQAADPLFETPAGGAFVSFRTVPNTGFGDAARRYEGDGVMTQSNGQFDYLIEMSYDGVSTGGGVAGMVDFDVFGSETTPTGSANFSVAYCGELDPFGV